MVNWIAAVRRCAVSKPGRHSQPSEVLTRAREIQDKGESVTQPKLLSVLPAPSTSESIEDTLLRSFVEANNSCAECGMQPVT